MRFDRISSEKYAYKLYYIADSALYFLVFPIYNEYENKEEIIISL